MTERPATPPAEIAPARFTYHQIWCRCEAEMSRNATHVRVRRAEGKEPVRAHVEGEIIFRQLCDLLDLIIRDGDLRAAVRDAAIRRAAETQEGQQQQPDGDDNDS